MGVNSRLDLPLQEHNHPEAYFAEEQRGWHGYVEWEKYPKKKKKAADILAQYQFAGVRFLYTSPSRSLTDEIAGT